MSVPPPQLPTIDEFNYMLGEAQDKGYSNNDQNLYRLCPNPGDAEVMVGKLEGSASVAEAATAALLAERKKQEEKKKLATASAERKAAEETAQALAKAKAQEAETRAKRKAEKAEEEAAREAAEAQQREALAAEKRKVELMLAKKKGEEEEKLVKPLGGAVLGYKNEPSIDLTEDAPPSKKQNTGKFIDLTKDDDAPPPPAKTTSAAKGAPPPPPKAPPAPGAPTPAPSLPPPANKGKVNDPGFAQADNRKGKKKVYYEDGRKVYEETEHEAGKDFSSTDRGSK